MAVLLVTDLEGVAGVDSLAALMEGRPEFALAQNRLGDEIAAAMAGFAAGALQAHAFVLGDTHMGGPSPNLKLDRVPAWADVRAVRSANPADPGFFAGVQAIAALGMHGGAAGFVPHCVDLAASFENDAGALSEAQLFLGVAAELGVPASFVAGDEALGDLGRVPVVVTKRSSSPTEARSRPIDEVLREIQAAAARPPVPAPALPGPLFLRFRSHWMADLAQERGAVRRDETSVALPGATVRERIAGGCALLAAAAPLAHAVRPWDLLADVSALASRSFQRLPPPEHQAEAARALTAFLATTLGDDDWSRANRALALHMLEGHAPQFFAATLMRRVLADAVRRLDDVPTDFPSDLAPETAMARLDAIYVRRQRGQIAAGPRDPAELSAYCAKAAASSPMHAWLMGEIAHALGLPGRLTPPPRPYRRSNRVADLYWLTHLFFLATRYLRDPFVRQPGPLWPAQIEELALAIPFALGRRHLDLAAELAICLVVAGEATSPERAQVLAALRAQQRPDGLVPDPDAASAADPEIRRRADAHCTAAALLAFATAV